MRYVVEHQAPHGHREFESKTIEGAEWLPRAGENVEVDGLSMRVHAVIHVADSGAGAQEPPIVRVI